MTSTERSNFRKRKVWTEFRESFKKEKDALTGSKLSKRFNLHHKCMLPSKYDDLSDRNAFCPLNTKSHDCIHFLYDYYVKDPAILDRLKDILEDMKMRNTGFNTKQIFIETPEKKNPHIEKRVLNANR